MRLESWRHQVHDVTKEKIQSACWRSKSSAEHARTHRADLLHISIAHLMLSSDQGVTACSRAQSAYADPRWCMQACRAHHRPQP